MKNDAFGLIYTGENNPHLKDLALSRSVAAVPFGGRYRCIDFILSDLVNSGVTNVGLITQKNYHSLMDHIGSGKEWDLHRKREGLFFLPPFMTKENVGVYRGSIDALRSVLGYVRRSAEKYVILSGSHTIFNMTFDGLLAEHVRSGADITVLYNEEGAFDSEDQNMDLRLILDGDGRVTEMEYDPYRPRSRAASCDVFVMEKVLLEYLVEESYARGETDFMRDVLLKKCGQLVIRGFRYDGYVARLNSLSGYFRHSMDLLDVTVRDDLFCGEHPIHTKVKDEVPTRYGANALARNAMLADGCHIDGAVENSILFRGVSVQKGATVRNSIVMQGTVVGEGATLEHVVLDKGVIIRPGRTLTGYDSFPIIVRKNTTV